MNPSLLAELRHQKGWRLIQVHQKLKDRDTPVSWPTLLKIDHGYKTVVVRNRKGRVTGERKIPYKPTRGILRDIAGLFKVKVSKVYEDRSND